MASGKKIMGSIVVFSIFFMVCIISSASAISGKEENLLTPRENKIRIGLRNLVQEVVNKNAGAVSDYLQAQISQEHVKREKGIFEPVLKSSLSRAENHIPNTAEDLLTRQQLEYFEDVNKFDVGVTGRVNTGATWDVQFIDRQRSSSVIDRYRPYEYEYDNSIKLSLEQPILKGFGKSANYAKINIAKVESEIDSQKLNQKLMELAAVAAQLYWKLYGTQKIEESWRKSLDIAENSIDDIEARAKGGKIAYTDLMEAQSAVSILRSEWYNAKSKVVEVQNQLFTLLNVPASEFKEVLLIATDNPFGDYEDITDRDRYVELALKKWPEYEIAKKQMAKEKIQLKYAENQLLPQFDIFGSVSLNSLDDGYKDSFRKIADDEFFSWQTGIKLSVPLYGNAQARSEKNIAEMRVKKAEFELEALEKSLANSVYSKIDAVMIIQEEVKEYERAMKIREQLREIEQAKFHSGRISLKELYDEEEDFVDFQRKLLSSIVNFKLAQATLQIATGKILEKYGIDPAEINFKTRVQAMNLKKDASKAH
ncbi:MAG: TolC family protein [Syntrophales bacterium]|nr:TolC family protein [Syntrophales bacterium]